MDVTHKRGAMTFTVPVYVHVEFDNPNNLPLVDYELANMQNAKIMAVNSVVTMMCSWN